MKTQTPARSSSGVFSTALSAAQLAAVLLSALQLAACSGDKSSGTNATASAADSNFVALTHAVIADLMKTSPSLAVDLGVHTYDDQVEDVSKSAIMAASERLKNFRGSVATFDTTKLSTINRADRTMLISNIDAAILGDDVIKKWTRDPDFYSSGVTNAAFVIMKRNFAPPTDRLKSLIARERKLPIALAEARKNLENPPKIYTQIALEQIDGSISFFKNDVPAAFTEVKDSALLKEFKATNDSVMAALASYKLWMQKILLPKSNGTFAYGGDTYGKALAASEMIEMPLNQLLEYAEKDRQKNEAAFQAVAHQIDSTKSVDTVHAEIERDHPAPNKLLEVTQTTLDSIRQFIIDKHIITIPPSEPARTFETPPFMRSTTSASMDTPGPFEPAKLPARYNMTLPDPRWKPAEAEEFMHQWYYAMISNVSVHEVYPGHYTQFLYARQFPTDVRKVYGANTNIEGWAHYAEQMMLDEGFHANDPKYRLAQLQDALLRDVRFIVGIKMHTQDMKLEDAIKLFETQAHQPKPVAISEAKRGTSDALYGYYTMGKLMIMKLRDDYKAKMGSQYSLQKFHDEFIKLGPLPLPLIRQAMLGETGKLFQ
ncbi:MAG: DUF885 domain-containing protein [Gemmatimonadaceae bacterium]